MEVGRLGQVSVEEKMKREKQKYTGVANLYRNSVLAA